MNNMATPEELFLLYRDEGDVAAFAALFDQVSPDLLALARRWTGSAADADAVVQDVFSRLIEHRDRIHLDGRLMALLTTMTIRSSIDLCRRRSHPADVERMVDEATECPLDLAIDAESASTIQRELAELAPSSRDLLREYLVEERGPTEIARRSGRSSGAVGMQIQRSLQLLRRRLPRGLAGIAGVERHSATGELRARLIRLATRTQGRNAALVASIGGWLVLIKLLGVCIFLATTAWWLISGVDSREVSSAATDRNGPATLRLAEADLALPDSRDDFRDAVVAPADAGAPRGTHGYFIQGRVLGVSKEDMAGVVVTVQPEGISWSADGIEYAQRALRATPDAEGSYRLDVSSLLTTNDAAPDKQQPGALHEHDQHGPLLWVVADHGMYVPSATSTVTRSEIPSSLDGETRCDLRLTRAAVALVRVRGRPWEYLQAKTSRGLEELGYTNSSMDGRDGTYRARLATSGVVEFQCRDLPYSQTVELSIGEERDVVIDPGLLAYELRLDSSPSLELAPWNNCQVLVTRAREPEGSGRSAQSASTSTFRHSCVNLFDPASFDSIILLPDPGPWTVSIESLSSALVLPGPTLPPRIVPGTSLDLLAGRCMIQFRLGEGAPVGSCIVAELTYVDPNSGSRSVQSAEFGDDRTLSVLGNESADYSIGIRRDGELVLDSMPLPASKRGRNATLILDLPYRSTGTVRLTPTPGSGVPGSIEADLQPATAGMPVIRRTAKLDDGAYELDDVPIGAYSRVRVASGHQDLYLQPYELGLVVQASSRTAAAVTFLPGGRAHIERSASPRDDCELRVARSDGGLVGIVTTMRDDRNGSGFTRTPGDGRTLGVLAPGTYRIECHCLEKHYRPADFEIRPGKTTSLWLEAADH